MVMLTSDRGIVQSGALGAFQQMAALATANLEEDRESALKALRDGPQKDDAPEVLLALSGTKHWPKMLNHYEAEIAATQKVPNPSRSFRAAMEAFGKAKENVLAVDDSAVENLFDHIASFFHASALCIESSTGEKAREEFCRGAVSLQEAMGEFQRQSFAGAYELWTSFLASAGPAEESEKKAKHAEIILHWEKCLSICAAVDLDGVAGAANPDSRVLMSVDGVAAAVDTHAGLVRSMTIASDLFRGTLLPTAMSQAVLARNSALVHAVSKCVMKAKAVVATIPAVADASSLEAAVALFQQTYDIAAEALKTLKDRLDGFAKTIVGAIKSYSDAAAPDDMKRVCDDVKSRSHSIKQLMAVGDSDNDELERVDLGVGLMAILSQRGVAERVAAIEAAEGETSEVFIARVGDSWFKEEEFLELYMAIRPIRDFPDKVITKHLLALGCDEELARSTTQHCSMVQGKVDRAFPIPPRTVSFPSFSRLFACACSRARGCLC